MECLSLGSLESRGWNRELDAGDSFKRCLREPRDEQGRRIWELTGEGNSAEITWAVYRTPRIVLLKGCGSCPLSMESFPTALPTLHSQAFCLMPRPVSFKVWGRMLSAVYLRKKFDYAHSQNNFSFWIKKDPDSWVRFHFKISKYYLVTVFRW